jgi:hypothetical protein
MLNKKRWLGILVIVLLFGIAVCGYTQDLNVNGTWVFEDTKLKEVFSSSFKQMFLSMLKQMTGGVFSPDDMKKIESVLEAMSDAEIRELLEASIEDGKLMLKDSQMILNNGKVENSMYGMLATKGTYTTVNGKMTTTTSQFYGEIFGLDSKWYSRKELLDNLKAQLGVDVPIPESETVDYSIRGNRLSLTNDYATTTYTRKR